MIGRFDFDGELDNSFFEEIIFNLKLERREMGLGEE